MENNSLTLETLAGGALAEQFEQELKKVLANIDDPNTDPKAARNIAIKITFKPDEDRDMAKLSISCTSSLAGFKSISSIAAIGIVDGEIVAQEFSKNAMKGQMTVKDYEEVPEPDSNVTKFKNAQTR